MHLRDPDVLGDLGSGSARRRSAGGGSNAHARRARGSRAASTARSSETEYWCSSVPSDSSGSRLAVLVGGPPAESESDVYARPTERQHPAPLAPRPGFGTFVPRPVPSVPADRDIPPMAVGPNYRDQWCMHSRPHPPLARPGHCGPCTEMACSWTRPKSAPAAPGTAASVNGRSVMLKRVLVAMLVSCVAAPAVLATPGHANCSATITGALADSCRDFTTHSSKDISYVKLFYVDGRTIKYEHINSHDWAIDGEAGDELDFVRVKSGTTVEEFACSPPTRVRRRSSRSTRPGRPGAGALLRLLRRPDLRAVGPAHGLGGHGSAPRCRHRPAERFEWGCGAFSDPSLCSYTIRFRGTDDSDPDGDITSWSLDFGDGTSVQRNVERPAGRGGPRVCAVRRELHRGLQRRQQPSPCSP